ncbi:MAG: hypothetical protein IK114_13465 [Fibrobacter sp.]|nr:hypothetical protein [Fibrobacter sp.]
MDIASSLQEGTISDFSECKRILRLVNEHVSSANEQTMAIKVEDGFLSGYLVPDIPGPGGRKRPVSFLVEGGAWRDESGQNLSDSICSTVRKLVGPDEIPDTQLEEFRRKASAIVDSRKRRPTGCLCRTALFAAVVVAILTFCLVYFCLV